MGIITENVRELLRIIPPDVRIVAAAKSRTPGEVAEAIDAGIPIIGENYLQDSREVISLLGGRADWHFIGHVQKNKVKHIVPLFDMIETVDSFELAALIQNQAERHGKIMPVLIEVNSGSESQKTGVLPGEVPGLVRRISALDHIQVRGLMTMGPFWDGPEGLRPCFRLTRELFDALKQEDIPGVDMQYLSMGMSDSFEIALEEGANLIRIGTRIFGQRS